MDTDETRIRKIWAQSSTPVIFRPEQDQLRVRLPYSPDNRAWLAKFGRRNPIWSDSKKRWEVPRSWFNKIIDNALARWGRIYVIQPHREQEKCAPACWRAKGHDCTCSCMGEHHGSENPSGSWFIVSDTFATSWGDARLSCKLLSKNEQLRH